jgi:hypothetical protein
VLVGSIDCPIVEAILEKDYSVVPNDVVDLNFPNICFPDSLHGSSLYDCLNDCDFFKDNFVPSVDDVDECLFVEESHTLPGSVSNDVPISNDVLVSNFEPVSNDSTPCCFGTVTEAELKNVRRGGVRCSKASERWVARSFDDWRQFCGISTEKSIGDLSEENDLWPLVQMLTRFILEVKKKDNKLHHSTRLFFLSIYYVCPCTCFIECNSV